MIQALGITRFSYPSEMSAFKVKQGSIEDRRAALYDPKRLDQRMLYWQHIAMPGLRAQTDPDFRLLVLIGDQMPTQARDRLEAITDDCPQIMVFDAPEGDNVTDICRAALTTLREPGANWVAEFRLDDDDAVAVDYIERSRKLAPVMANLRLAGEMRTCVDFAQGISAIGGEDGIRFTPVTTRFWPCALTMYVKPRHPKCVLDYHHRRLWHRMPSVTIPQPVMYVRGAHDFNDAGKKDGAFQSQEEARPDLDADTARTLMRERFAIDTDALQDAWAKHHRDFPS